MRLRGWMVFCVLYLLAATASAQNITGSIVGTVTDPSGAVVIEGHSHYHQHGYKCGRSNRYNG